MTARAASGFWRITGALACIGYAGMALLFGLDREGTGDQRLLGWAYATGSGFAATSAAVTRGDAGAALAQARALVRQDPANPRAIGLFGVTLLLAQQADAARDAFALGARLGWRDAATQRYEFVQALQAGDAARAARHLDALLRQTPDLADRDSLLAAILAYEQGRAAVATQLQGDPGWAQGFVSHVGALDSDDLAARADVVQRTGTGHWACTDAAPLIDGLLGRGAGADANAVHRTVCPGDGGMIHDGDFNRLAAGGGASALDWNLISRGDLVSSVNPVSANRHVLTLALASPSTVMALSQVTTAGPGTYRISWRMPDTSAHDAAALLVSFDCANDLGQAIAGSTMQLHGAAYGAQFVVGSTCMAPVLRFWLMPNHPVNLADVRIDPVSGG